MKLIPLVLLLSACATTPEGIRREAIDQTLASAKSPMEIARCLKDLMPGLDIYPGDHEVSVSNKNQFGSILINWRLIEDGTGSKVEIRRTNSIAPGINRSTRCF